MPANWDPASIKISDHYHHELHKYTKARISDEKEYKKWDHEYYAEKKKDGKNLPPSHNV